MKHILPDPEQEKKLDNQFTVFSCEFDSGVRANGNTAIIRLGEDGKILLFVCSSCLEQLKGQILGDFVSNVLHNDKEFKNMFVEATIGKNKVSNE